MSWDAEQRAPPATASPSGWPARRSAARHPRERATHTPASYPPPPCHFFWSAQPDRPQRSPADIASAKRAPSLASSCGWSKARATGGTRPCHIFPWVGGWDSISGLRLSGPEAHHTGSSSCRFGGPRGSRWGRRGFISFSFHLPRPHESKKQNQADVRFLFIGTSPSEFKG